MVGRRLRPWPLIQLLGRVIRENTLWADIKPLLRGRLLLMKNTPRNESNPAPPALFQMATGYWLSQAIYVAAKLGIADLLTEGPKSSAELAAATGVDAPSLFRVLRALAGVGVFSHTGSDYFALAPLGEGFRTDVSGSLRATLPAMALRQFLRIVVARSSSQSWITPQRRWASAPSGTERRKSPGTKDSLSQYTLLLRRRLAWSTVEGISKTVPLNCGLIFRTLRRNVPWPPPMSMIWRIPEKS